MKCLAPFHAITPVVQIAELGRIFITGSVSVAYTGCRLLPGGILRYMAQIQAGPVAAEVNVPEVFGDDQ